MKNRVCLVLAVVFGCLASAHLRADDLFQLFWRGTYYSTNSIGHIVAVRFTEQDIVSQAAQSAGLDASQLVFVYRPNKRDAVVVRSNGSFVSSVFQMQSTFTDINNPSGSVTVRHALLSDGSHQNPLGSFFGLEMRSLDANGGLIADTLTGSSLYSNPDSNMVYSAQVSTGPRIVDTTNAP